MVLGALAAAVVGDNSLFVVGFLTALLVALLVTSYLKNRKPSAPREPRAPKPAKPAKQAKPSKVKVAGGSTVAGTVKWFNRDKGFGFIEQDGGGDVFVHHNDIEGSGRKFLREGQKVTMQVVAGDKGPQATNVERIN